MNRSLPRRVERKEVSIMTAAAVLVVVISVALAAYLVAGLIGFK
ncbi:hypothetical protein [Mesorhizobium sp. M0320]